MDKYIQEDRKAVADTFSSVKTDIDAMIINEDITVDDIVKGLCKCSRDVEALKLKLQHNDGIQDAPDMAGAVRSNSLGVTVTKNSLIELSKALQDSIADTSWVEDIDTFKESQKDALDQLNNIINSLDATEFQKREAKEVIKAIEPMTPKADTPEWLIRKMKADHTVMGLQSMLMATIVDAAKM